MRPYRQFYVYILASLTRVLYIGITNNLEKRLWEHRHKALPGFTADYNVNRLVYFEVCDGPLSAIAREKQLKAWRRKKKVRLINDFNPLWRDLAEDWYQN